MRELGFEGDIGYGCGVWAFGRIRCSMLELSDFSR